MCHTSLSVNSEQKLELRPHHELPVLPQRIHLIGVPGQLLQHSPFANAQDLFKD